MSIFKLVVGTLLGAVGVALVWYLGSMVALQGFLFVPMVIIVSTPHF